MPALVLLCWPLIYQSQAKPIFLLLGLSALLLPPFTIWNKNGLGLRSWLWQIGLGLPHFSWKWYALTLSYSILRITVVNSTAFNLFWLFFLHIWVRIFWRYWTFSEMFFPPFGRGFVHWRPKAEEYLRVQSFAVFSDRLLRIFLLILAIHIYILCDVAGEGCCKFRLGSSLLGTAQNRIHKIDCLPWLAWVGADIEYLLIRAQTIRNVLLSPLVHFASLAVALLVWMAWKLF